MLDFGAQAPRPPLTTDTALHSLAAPPDRSQLNDYIVAILAAVVALLVRAAIDPLVQSDRFYVLCLLAVVFVSWRSGFGPALVTLLLCMIGMVYFFIEPVRSFIVLDLSNQLATAIFLFCGVFCAALGEAQRRAREVTKEALEQKDSLAAEIGRRTPRERVRGCSEAWPTACRPSSGSRT
jgi:K+-sensing histidine kinase KdpD